MHPWCSIQSINWVHGDACRCSTHIWVPWDKRKGGQRQERCRGGTVWAGELQQHPVPWGPVVSPWVT